MSIADERSLEAMLEVINDPTIDDIDARFSRSVRDPSMRRTWRPASIDDLITFGKHKDQGLSYRDVAAKDPGYLKWAASNIAGLKGQLAAEALADRLLPAEPSNDGETP